MNNGFNPNGFNSYNTYNGNQNQPNNFNQKVDDFMKGVKNTGKNIGIFVLIVFAVILLSSFFYQVDETEHAIRYRFNEIVAVNVNNLTESEMNDLLNDEKYNDVRVTTGAGLKFKIPFIDRVEKFSNQLITYDTMPREVITSDKKKLILDNNAQWWIVNPIRFKITMNSINSANQRIEDLMYSKMNEKIGRTVAHKLIADKDYVEEMLIENANELNEILAPYGIRIADIRIKRTDLPVENNENIFNRMRTERQQMARQYRSEGREEAQKIKASAEREAAEIRAKANAEAQRIRGKGDADAAAIFNKAYNADPEFYAFYKTLETYKAILPESGAKIIITPDSEFAKYLYGSK